MTTSLAAPGLVAAQEAGDQAATGEHSDSSEGHGEKQHHENHAALFVGTTEAEEQDFLVLGVAFGMGF